MAAGIYGDTGTTGGWRSLEQALVSTGCGEIHSSVYFFSV